MLSGGLRDVSLNEETAQPGFHGFWDAQDVNQSSALRPPVNIALILLNSVAVGFRKKMTRPGTVRIF